MGGATRGAGECFADAPDGLLADRAGDGDAAAFAALLRRHTPALRAYVRRVLGGTDEVDDVVQDTFITAWDRLGSLEDRAAVRGWLFRIAYRKSMDRVRARRHHDDVADHDPSAAPHLEPEAGPREDQEQQHKKHCGQDEDRDPDPGDPEDVVHHPSPIEPPRRGQRPCLSAEDVLEELLEGDGDAERRLRS